MPNLPENTCIYAIGDVHGRADLLKQLHKLIKKDAATNPHLKKILIYLGDFIDRGNASKQVVDLMLESIPGFESIYLRGNHETMLLKFLEDYKTGELWFMNGGLETLMSYRVSLALLNELNYEKLAASFKQKLPPEHLAFFNTLKTHYTNGNYYFCHAGIDPDTPLEQQTEEDLLWIRESFTFSKKNFAKVVVHGHTVTQNPVLLPNRIGVDTGAIMSNHLTCAVLTNEKPYFLTT